MVPMAARPILLVEDEPDDMQFVRRALKRAELVNPLLIATSVEEAQTHCRDGVIPVLVLLDVYLKRRSGLEFLEWLRDQPPPLNDTPVVIFSMSTDGTHRTRAQALRSSLFLGKPATEEVLADAIAAFGLVRTTEVHQGRRLRWLEAREATAS